MGFVILPNTTNTKKDSLKSTQVSQHRNHIELRFQRQLTQILKFTDQAKNTSCNEFLELLRQEEAKLDSLRDALEVKRVIEQELKDMLDNNKKELKTDAMKLLQ